MEVVNKERVIAYIDGFNLYFGLKDSGYDIYKWLNVQNMVQKLLKPTQSLIQVNYFTTLITNDVETRLRQKQYIGALQTMPLIKVVYGKFQQQKSNCKKCGNDYNEVCEKMTDVAIATTLMKDYYEDSFDMAMIISGDTDLLPPIKSINENSKTKRVFVAFPPDRINDDVKKFAKGFAVIGRKVLSDSQLPLTNVNTLTDETFTKPKEWA